MKRPEPPDEHAPGSRIGHYEVVRVLGRGGMGVVYEARDTKLDRRVALKTPLSADGNTLKRFEREGRAASRLLHPHIVPVLDVFEHGGWPYLVMEFVEGEDLGSRIHRVGPFQPTDILRHAEGLADALRLAHAKGVLHRDIKPGNILVDASGTARLTDFGLARFIATGDPEAEDPTLTMSLTRTGAQLGTMVYMSPEQMLGKPLTPASDIFSLGAVMYEMCTGRRAFAADSQGEVLDQVLHREPDAMARFNYELPEQLEPIVRKAMAKRPDERYQTASDLLVDVRALRRRFESGTLDSIGSIVRPAPRPRYRRLAPFLLAAGALLVVAAAAAIWWTGGEPPAPTVPLSRPLQLTTAPGWEAEPALSPDGGFVAYTSDQSGNSDLWIVDVRGGDPLQLTDDPAPDRSPAWFPDNGNLAFVSERSGSPAIWKMPRLGGTPVLLIPGAEDPAISPDGTRIAYSTLGENDTSRIAVTDLDEPAGPRFLTTGEDGLFEQRKPRWSPDGQRLVYQDFRDLWVVPLNGGTARRLTTEHSTDREAIWSVDGRFIYFSSFREDTDALWQVRLRDGAATRLTLGTGPERQPSLSRDGTRLAYSTLVDRSDIVLFDRDRGEQLRLPGHGRMGSPALTPDGSALAFTSSRRGRPEIWLQPLADGLPDGDPRLLIEQPGTFANLSFSPDGRYLAYLRVHRQQRDIWILDIDGGVPQQCTEDTAVDTNPSWSPLGDRLAFVSDRGGPLQLWTIPIRKGRKAGAAAQLTQADGRDLFPAWSPDGAQVAFLRAGEVWVVDVGGAAPPRQLTRNVEARRIRWAEGSAGLYVSGKVGGDRYGIYSISLENGAPIGPDLGVDFGDPQAAGQFDVTRDGRLLAFSEERLRGDVWITHADP